MNRRRALLAVFAALGGCARPGPTLTGALGPARLDPDAFWTDDGVRLPMDVWPARDADGAAAAPLAVVVALHGMNDYANAFCTAGPFWARRGLTTYAYDQRGFGRGPARGRWPRDGAFASDLVAICALLRRRHPGVPIAVVGESMGGAVAIDAFARRTPPEADRLILLSPAVWGWSEQPLINKIALAIAARLEPKASLTPPAWVYRGHPASDNIAMLRRMGQDPNMIFRTRIDATYGLVQLMEAAARRIGRVRAPVFYAYGAHDTIIPLRAAMDAAARLPPGARTAYYPDGWHLLNRDLHADVVLEDVAAFIRDPEAEPPSGAPPIPRRDTGPQRPGEGRASAASPGRSS